jgi:tRNA modification GTPase
VNAALPTRVALLTGPGRGAVASIRVDGPGAIELVGPLFHPLGRRSLADTPADRILVGRWQSATVGEEVVVGRPSPTSVEIHCHGGPVPARAILTSLVAAGCVETSWPQWRRTTTVDPLAAEAEIALAKAATARTALVLLDQAQGALRAAIESVRAQIASGALAAALAEIDALLAWQGVGLHLTQPWRVALAGPPNVGKSSLLNALAGYERAIVHATPGTTRDVVTASTAIDGWPVELADTAGLRTSADALEAAGIERAKAAAETADLTLLVFDHHAAWTSELDHLVKQSPGALLVANKSDRPAAGGGPETALRTSALTGDGIEALLAAIGKRLVPADPVAGQAMPFLVAQVVALAAARRALEGQDVLAAGRALAACEQARATC